MNATLITCTGDRPEAFALCEKYVAAQSVKPFQWLVLDDGETPATCTQGQEYYHLPQFRGRGSMTAKLRWALDGQYIKGDALLFWEDDDYYHPDYIAWALRNLQRFDLIGEARNIYYNVERRWWFEHGNQYHASLCATACRRSVFPQLQKECFSDDPFVDSRLWANCRLSKMPFDPAKHPNVPRMSIGIKAMPGRKGYGEGHRPHADRAIPDPDLTKLRQLIGPDAAEAYAKFYKAPSVPAPVTPRADGIPTVEVHIVTFNEEMILPYTLRHYQTFAAKIVVHDSFSTDRTRAICAEFGVEVRDFDTNGEINDILLKQLKETAWNGTTADWVAMVDADEFLYFPQGAKTSLESYDQQGLAFVKPHGYEMFSDSLPKGSGQIYDEIKQGAPDSKWYAKPVLFSAKRVESVDYMVGAHECRAVLKNGLRMINPVRVSFPPCWMLHYHQIGGLERIAAKYDAHRNRLAKVNRDNNWGWTGDGRRHAMDKRTAILSRLQQII